MKWNIHKITLLFAPDLEEEEGGSEGPDEIFLGTEGMEDGEE
jgi:hypothetical protein